MQQHTNTVDALNQALEDFPTKKALLNHARAQLESCYPRKRRGDGRWPECAPEPLMEPVQKFFRALSTRLEGGAEATAQALFVRVNPLNARALELCAKVGAEFIPLPWARYAIGRDKTKKAHQRNEMRQAVRAFIAASRANVCALCQDTWGPFDVDHYPTTFQEIAALYAKKGGAVDWAEFHDAIALVRTLCRECHTQWKARK